MNAFSRFLLFLSIFVTGFSALVYEVIWQRELSYIIGSQARSTAIILAVFLGTLALGYLAFGKLSRARSSRWLIFICGLAEALIGVWALLFPRLKQIAFRFAEMMPPDHSLVFLWDSLICVVLIGVPSLLMGGTLPLLTQGLASGVKDASRIHALIYAVNTAGAFLGCLAAGFVIVPMLGLHQSMFEFGLVNIVVGAGISVLSKFASDAPKQAPGIDKFEHGERVLLPLLVAFLAGFSSIALQTVLMRLTGLSLGSSEYAFSMIVAAYIALLSIGAFSLNVRERPLIPLWCNQLLSAISLLLLFMTVYAWPYVGHVIRTLFTSSVPSFYAFHATAFIILYLILLIPVGCMGSAMPLLFDTAKADAQKLGGTVGKLYGINALGCVFGAIFGGYLALYRVNLDGVFRLILLSLILSFYASLPPSLAKKKVSHMISVLLLVGFSLLTCYLPSWDYHNFAHGTFRSQVATEQSYRGPKAFFTWFRSDSTLDSYKDGPNTTVAVTHSGDGANLTRSILINGKSDGSTMGGDRSTTKLLAHLAALFGSEQTGRVGVIGFGTGITVGSLSQYEKVKNISVFEISSNVKDVAPLFDFANHQASKSPKLNWHIGDAYRYLGFSSELYDAIVSEPSNPWVAGVEQLYSKEFLERVKLKLSSGGVYAQWFHTYSMGRDTFFMIVNTFSHVFPHTRIFQTGADVILLGSSEDLGIEKLKLALARYQREAEAKSDLSDINIQYFDQLLLTEVLVSPKAFWRSPIHTLSHPRLSYMAGKDFYTSSDVDVDSYLLTAQARVWSNSIFGQSFLKILATEVNHPEYPFAVVSKRACGTDLNEFFKGWEQAAPFCRLMLLSAWGANIPVTGDQSVTEELSKIRELMPDQAADSKRCVADPNADEGFRTVLRFGKRYVSSLHLDHEKLLCKVAPCFIGRTDKAKECRVRLIEALAFTGRPDLAKQQLKAYKKDLGEIPESLTDEESILRLIEDSQMAYGVN